MNILVKKMTLIDFVFPKLRTVKTWLDKCLKSNVSEDPLKSSIENGLKHCWNLLSQHLYQIYWSMRRQLSCKKSLLVICQILRRFANILASNNKYPIVKRDNLMIPIQMQLSLKEKFFSIFRSIFDIWTQFLIFWMKRWPS